MIHLTPHTRNLATFGLALLLVFSAAAYTLGAITGPKYTFYDGEGNVIPYHAVDSLVRSQFVHETAAGKDTISKYFN